MVTNTYLSLLLAISQSHLNLWQICQRRFQHFFLDRLTAPTEAEQYERLTLGSRFHLLMQQKELGLEVGDLASSNESLQRWLLTFETHPPEMIQGDRYSEHRRTLDFNLPMSSLGSITYTLTSIYDLLIIGAQSAQILDWKTHQQPRSHHSLKQDWQTKLYLYVLAETSHYLPEQLSIIYWFANSGTAVTIPYSQLQHQQVHQELQQILQEITQAQKLQSFTQLDLEHANCQTCEFVYRCSRASSELEKGILNLEAIAAYPEIVI